MNLIVRADDFGYCEAVNHGIFRAVEQGIVTTVELMVDMPGSEEAAAKLVEWPFIGVALHCHFQGQACAPLEQVPTLVDETGHLVLRERRKADPTYHPDMNEQFVEWCAQQERFRELTGRRPDYVKPIGPNAAKMKAWAKEHDVPCDYRGGYELGMRPIHPDPEWEYLDYYTTPVMITKEQEDPRNQAFVDSIAYFTDDVAGILTCGHENVEMVMHPGWVDDTVFQGSSYTMIRVKDLIALTSDTVKAWVRDNGVQLASAYDVLHGTHRYQDYIRARGDVY